MRRLSILLILFSGALILWGCPYASDVPVDEPCIRVDKGLYGKWRIPSEEKSYAELGNLSRGDSTSYRLIYNLWSVENNTYEINLCKAWLSRVKERWFLNIQPESKSGGNIFICAFQCDKSQETIHLKPIAAEDAPRFGTSSDLRKWIARNMRKKDFFESEISFVRVK